jgi:hypothetical protein
MYTADDLVLRGHMLLLLLLLLLQSNCFSMRLAMSSRLQ